MTVLGDHLPASTAPGSQPARRRPVILATLAVRFEPDAERMAVESALEAGVPLIVVNGFWLPPGLHAGICLQADLEAVRETARRAAGAGIGTELLMLVCPRGAVRGLVRLARERDAGLVVFGPDRRRTGRRRFRRAARAVSDGLDCLVWIAGES